MLSNETHTWTYYTFAAIRYNLQWDLLKPTVNVKSCRKIFEPNNISQISLNEKVS